MKRDGEQMEKVERLRVRTGQARWWQRAGKRILQMNGWAAVWYVFLVTAGIVLYRAIAVYATRQRGYYAVGGEALIPLLLVLCYGIAVMMRKIVRSCKNERRMGGPFGQRFR